MVGKKSLGPRTTTTENFLQGKYNLSLDKLLVLLAKAGLNNEEIGEVLGMSANIFSSFLSQNPEVREIIEDAREEPNFRVEQSLFKRALGYKTKEIVKEDGKPVKVTIKEIAPDVVACIFWLKNRDPKRWRDVVEMKFSLRDRVERVNTALNEAKQPLSLAGK